jgi:hypothetical protein
MDKFVEFQGKVVESVSKFVQFAELMEYTFSIFNCFDYYKLQVNLRFS